MYTELKFARPSNLSPIQADNQRERQFTPLYGQKRRGGVSSQASLSLRGNQSPRNRPPTDPSHPEAGWHRQQWTWGCFRSWGWGKAEVLTAASVSVALPPFPAATALPFCPSRWLHDCWTWEEKQGASDTDILEDQKMPCHQWESTLARMGLPLLVSYSWDSCHNA